jgi:predicted nucleotidyltransferase
MHFYESSIITTTDCLHCQVYGNEHPLKGILVKPKYIPTDKISCPALPFRFISGKKMNRLNLWIDKKELKGYIGKFSSAYPDYVYQSDMHGPQRLFFWVPIEKIERVYYPKKGIGELMSIPYKELDAHLQTVYGFVTFLLGSGLKLDDLGLTYSTLMGHYFSNISDINIVVYGKKNFWKLMEYLARAKHEKLRWKTKAI